MSKLSDIENIFKSRNLIENLQLKSSRISIKNSLPPFRQEEILRSKNIPKCNWKETELLKLGTLHSSHDLQKEHKQIEVLNREKNTSKIRKSRDVSSDSEDFLSPNKKRKKSKVHSVNIFSHPDKVFNQTCFPITSVKNFQTKDGSLVKRVPPQGMSKSQRDLMVIPRQKTAGNQSKNASNQESCGSRNIGSSSQDISKSPNTSTSQESVGSKMITSSQESCGSKMITSSQDTLKIITSSQESSLCQNVISNQDNPNSQMSISQESCVSKMITSSQDTSKIITSSQESPVCRSIMSSQESCTSPKRITSSQESLGNKVMNISIEEESNILNIASQSSCEAQVVNTTNINSSHGRIMNYEEAKCLESNTMNQGVNLNKLKLYNQLSLGNDTRSHKKMKISDKTNFTEILASSVSDTFYNKTFRRYNKAEKRMIWNIRRRELELAKKEKEIETREKLLDAREADIRKREEILKASQRRYFLCKANMKKIMQKQTINPKELRQKMSVLVDENKSFSGTCL